MIDFDKRHIGAITFLLGVMIGLAIVGNASFAIFPILRFVLLTIAIISIFDYIINFKADFSFLASFITISLFFGYAALNTVISGLNIYSSTQILQSFFVIVAGVHFAGATHKGEYEKFLLQSVIFFSIFLVIFFIFTGELTFQGVPQFAYEKFTSDGTQLSYSQGTSAFFGVAAICSLLAIPNSFNLEKLILTVFFLIFTFLSFIGGGRGEIILLVITLLFVSIGNPSARRMFFIIILVFILFLPFLIDTIDVFQFTSVVRFRAFFEADFGLRDLLFEQSIDLLFGDNRCFFFGCGYGIFQDYYGYDRGLYPHNIVLEGMLAWGVPSFSILLFVAAYGWIKTSKLRTFSIIGMYFFLIGLKSGNIIDSWLAISFLFFFAGVGMSLLFTGKYINISNS